MPLDRYYTTADDDTQVLRYRLTTLPASSVRWAIVVGAGLLAHAGIGVQRVLMSPAP